MVKEKQKQAHLWIRDQDDWYVEPASSSLALFDIVEFEGKIWDPACGMGRIIKSAQLSGFSTKATDKVKRTGDCAVEIDFLTADISEFSGCNVVSNPPFKLAEEFVQKSLNSLDEGKVCAFLLPLVWMAGFSSKRPWLPNSPLLSILPISPRPSMPPGRVIMSGERPGNGTKDFGWFVWKKGYSGDATVEFMNVKGYKDQGRSIDELLDLSLCELKAAE